MAARWSDAALDDELARRVEAQTRIADALVELEGHPGHRLLATATLTGTSAQRWARVRELLPRLWADLATHRTAVAAACAVRTRRARAGEQEWAELHRLLVDRSIEAGRTPVALRDRLGGAVEQVRAVTLGELADGMDAAFREAVDVVETAESVHLAAVAGLGPLAERLRDARHRAAALLDPADPDTAALAAIAAAVDARLASCAADPLAYAGRTPAELADGLVGSTAGGAAGSTAGGAAGGTAGCRGGSAGRSAGGLAAVEARLAALAAVREAWPQQHAAVAGAVAALDGLWEAEGRARRAAV
ncbi:MAG TPA: hypothetical protein VF667_05455, partial [Pseudonocardia sp.]